MPSGAGLERVAATRQETGMPTSRSRPPRPQQPHQPRDQLGLWVTVGVDTHLDSHVAAVVDATARSLGWRSFPATPAGYRRLLEWAQGFGPVARIGVEGTGCWGLGLTRYLIEAGMEVIEVLRPGRRDRRQNGKSDPIDADAAARAVLSGAATNQPKSRDGRVEAIRLLKVARDSAVKARIAAARQLASLIVTAPEPLRSDLSGLTLPRLVTVCAAFDVDLDALGSPHEATRAAMQALASRWQQLDAEAKTADRHIAALVRAAAPQLLARPGIGAQSAATLLTTIGDNPARLGTEAAFAHLCGVAPLPASSGRVTRHRLNHGGDRQANRALYTIVITRMRIDPRTRDYVARRTAEGLSKKELIRCLKRYVAREVHRLLTQPPAPDLTPAT
jgi:transposase